MIATADPPGPTGAAIGRLNAQLIRADVFTFLSNLTRVYGDIVRFDIGHTACVLVNGAAGVDTLLRSRESFLQKPDYVSASNRGHWGDGLTTLEGADWQDRRRILRPQFRPREIAHRLDVVAECTTDMLRRWQIDTPKDLIADIRLLTARIAARTVMGADIEGWGDPAICSCVLPINEIVGEDFSAAKKDEQTRVFRMVRPRAPRNLPVITDLIKRRLKSDCVGKDVLSVLIRNYRDAGMAPDLDVVVGEVVQMLYAGHLTIPASLGALWTCLSQDAQAEGRIVEEADALNVGNGTPVQPKIGRSFVLAALKEAIRLYPPAPILYREVAQSFELEGFKLCEGHQVWVSPRLLHRDPRYFVDPDTFQPNHFAFGQPKNIPRSVYLPFGAGPRTCIAMHQSFNQMAVIALMIAQRFGVRPEGDNRWLVSLNDRG